MTEIDRDGEIKRLFQIVDLVKKEDVHLQAVSERLFQGSKTITDDWVSDLISRPLGEDRLESFAAKFSRMQDTIIDKLLPQLLRASGELPGTAIDNLNRAERLELIIDANSWIMMRRLRNKLVHEYIDSPTEMLSALQQAQKFATQLHETTRRTDTYIKTHLNQ